MFYLDNLSQGRGVECSHWYHSMANITLYKIHRLHFYVSSHRFRDINILNLWLKNMRKVIEYSIRSHAIWWRTSTSKVISLVFTLALIVFEIPTFRNVNFINAGQCHSIQNAPMQIWSSKKSHNSRFRRYYRFVCLTFKISVKVTEYNLRVDSIRWLVPAS